MSEKYPKTDKEATEYLLKWMDSLKKKYLHQPEAFIKREPGLYIGGLRLMPGDTVVTDNHGLPRIIGAGCCE